MDGLRGTLLVSIMLGLSLEPVGDKGLGGRVKKKGPIVGKISMPVG